MQKFDARALALGALLAGTFCSAALADDKYGAIAFSQDTGRHGYSYNYDSRGEAERRALNECGRGCTVAVWFRNACGALAVGEDNAYGSGWSTSRREAENIAMNGCGEHSGSCSVVRWACTDR
jgi:serine/threonine-protein kinase